MTIIISTPVPTESWRRRMVHESIVLNTVDKVLRNPQGIVAVAGLLILLLAALLAGVVAPYDPVKSTAAASLGAPSLSHPFGTDELQRDLLTRVLYGLRLFLLVSVLSVSFGAAVGIFIGFTAGYAAGWVDAASMRCVDALLAFPGLLTALGILTILGPGSRNVGIAIAIFSVPAFARLSRAQMLREKYRDYVFASRSLGAGPWRLIFRHIARNALAPLITQVALAMAGAILIAAALSYLGLGEPPPAPSLGSLINSSRAYLQESWWYLVFPSAMLALLVLCLNLLADAVNDATNPYTRKR